MFTILIVLSVIIAVLLILVVLMQASKGGGLSGSVIGGGQMGAMMGVRGTANLLSKLTWYLAGALVVLALVINLFFLPANVENAESVIQKAGKGSVPTVPSVPQSQPTK